MLFVELPLYADADYEYDLSLEGNYYTFRLYYNERADGWYFELRDGENTLLVAGERLVPSFFTLLSYNLENLSGFLWLEPIGDPKNETVINPFELSQYYRLFYIYPEESDLE